MPGLPERRGRGAPEDAGAGQARMRFLPRGYMPGAGTVWGDRDLPTSPSIALAAFTVDWQLVVGSAGSRGTLPGRSRHGWS